jgi:perosamine synthetase
VIPLSVPSIGPDEQEAVIRVLQSGQLAAGPEVAAFEAEFADFSGVPEAVATSNGTTALWLGLWAAGVGPGDELIVPSFTFAATAGVVALTGARPIFADIDPLTFCISADTVRPLIGPDTAAVIAVHLYGHPAPLDELSELCHQNGLLLVEDAAQAHGARWDGEPVGGIGGFGAFSFYATKNMTTGEGGILTTADSSLAEKVRSLRSHGMGALNHERLGTNARMTEMAGALGRVQLRRLPGWIEQRRTNAGVLTERIADSVTTPWVHPAADHAYHLYTVRCSDRDRLARALDAAEVGHGIYYPVGCHHRPAFAAEPADLPETERACSEVISLPIRPDLTESDLASVAQAVIEGTR